jgi:polar amino acid transport system substrate-binding protein
MLRAYRLRLLCWVIGLAGCCHAAEPLRLATGDYAPFTGTQLPNGGPLTEMVRRAFAASGTNVAVDYLPWKRGYTDTLDRKYDAAFPYGRNPERERDFYFSESYYTVDRRMYYLASAGLKPQDFASLTGKRYCLPLGFVLFPELSAMVERKDLEILSPPSLASCVKMLALKRVDFFITTPDIAELAMAQQGADNGITSQSVGKSENHLIVAKTHPRGADIVATFNRGIAALRNKGDIDKIMRDSKLPQN